MFAFGDFEIAVECLDLPGRLIVAAVVVLQIFGDNRLLVFWVLRRVELLQ